MLVDIDACFNPAVVAASYILQLELLFCCCNCLHIVAASCAMFLQTVLDRIAMLVPLFSKINMEQVTSFAKLTNTLSPGQIVLAIHLLDTFGFAVDAIGQNIPTVSSSASSFWIGPIKVTLADRSSSSSSQASRPAGLASWFRHPLFGGLFG
jgi:hypothetical protein